MVKNAYQVAQAGQPKPAHVSHFARRFGTLRALRSTLPLALRHIFKVHPMITGINHITFSVRDLQQSIEFYRDLLGMKLHVFWDKGAYLTAGDTWVCLSLGQPEPSRDYTHVAFSISEGELRKLRTKLNEVGAVEWKQNTSEGDSIYLLDPNGHRLELHCGTLATRLAELRSAPYKGLVWC